VFTLWGEGGGIRTRVSLAKRRCHVTNELFPPSMIYSRPLFYLPCTGIGAKYKGNEIFSFYLNTALFFMISKWFSLTSVADLISIFPDSDPEIFCHFRIRILRLIFWQDIFLQSGSHCVYMYSCKTEKKFYYRKNVHFVLFQMFKLWFFWIISIL
jgi:hypothetical protein